MKKFLIIVMVLIMAFSTVVLAGPGGYQEGLLPTPDTSAGIGNIGATVTGVMQTVAYVVAVAVLMFVGIKFMLASPAEKANIKGMMVPYIIGAVLIFAAGGIIGIIGEWAGKIN